jgi:hypothetical protein
MRLKLALLLTSLTLSLLLAEAAFRLARPLWAIPYPPVCFWPQLYQRFDPHGYRLWPSRRAEERYPPASPRTLSIVSNSDGFRSRRELREPDRRPRILVLGDSMVFGSGVEESERFTELLEGMEPGWRVENLGMVGYGTDLMLRALETVGIALGPDVVVFAVFSHDVYRVMPEATGVGFPLPRYVLESGRLVTVPYPARPFWSRLRLVEGVRYLYWRYGGASLALNTAILDRFRALAAERRFVPALVFLPPKKERWDDRRRRGWLRRYAERYGTAFLDLTEPVREAGGERLYLAGDAHWNAEGHRAVAEALRPFVAHLVPSESVIDPVAETPTHPAVPRCSSSP